MSQEMFLTCVNFLMHRLIWFHGLFSCFASDILPFFRQDFLQFRFGGSSVSSLFLSQLQHQPLAMSAMLHLGLLDPVVLYAVHRHHRAKVTNQWRTHWDHPVNQLHGEEGEFSVHYKRLCEFPDKFQEYFRLSVDEFDFILHYIIDDISKEDTNWQCSILAELKLALLLRWVHAFIHWKWSEQKVHAWCAPGERTGASFKQNTNWVMHWLHDKSFSFTPSKLDLHGFTSQAACLLAWQWHVLCGWRTSCCPPAMTQGRPPHLPAAPTSPWPAPCSCPQSGQLVGWSHALACRWIAQLLQFLPHLWGLCSLIVSEPGPLNATGTLAECYKNATACVHQ